MKYVEPIRDEKKLKQLSGNHFQDYLLFSLGVNTGLWVSAEVSCLTWDAVSYT